MIGLDGRLVCYVLETTLTFTKLPSAYVIRWQKTVITPRPIRLGTIVPIYSSYFSARYSTFFAQRVSFSLSSPPRPRSQTLHTLHNCTKTLQFSTAHFHDRARPYQRSLHHWQLAGLVTHISISIPSLTASVLYTNHYTPSSRPPTSATNRRRANHSTHSLLILPLSCHITHLNIRTSPYHRFATNYSSPLSGPHRCFVPSLTWTSQLILHPHRQLPTSNKDLSVIVDSWSQPHFLQNRSFIKSLTN